MRPVATAPSIDWREPWNSPLRRWGAPAGRAWAAGATVHAALNDLAAAPLRFVAQEALPRGLAYEQFIFEQRAVPTRDNPHDFFNGLIWCAFPLAKQRLNALQHAEIVRRGVQDRRGPLRDALTVFDENAALLHAPDALWQALAERRWGELFGPLRPLWRRARLLLFGHAALEQLLAPYKSITAHAWRVALPFDPVGELSALDAWLAHDLGPEKLAAKPFAPLPLLGVPGWWAANRAPGFYDDANVFRPLRSRA